MHKHYSLLTAATLAAGTFAFLGYDSTLSAQMQGSVSSTDQPQSPSLTVTGRAELPQGVTRAEQTDATGIHNALTDVTNVAILNIEQLPNYLTQSDRQRLANFAQLDHTRLKTALGSFRNNWKQKYNQDFDLSGPSPVVFGNQYRDFVVVQGEVSNPALLSNWPVQSTEQRRIQSTTPQGYQRLSVQQPTRERDTGEYHQAGGPGQPDVNLIPGRPESRGYAKGERTPTEPEVARAGQQVGPGYVDVGGPGVPPGAVAPRDQAIQAGQPQAPGQVTTLTRGMNVAIATFPAGHGLPETTVSLVREAGPAQPGAVPAGAAAPEQTTWRLDLPDSFNSADLSTRLANHIEGLNAGQNSWPNDVNEAYRLVTHHVMQALYETPAPVGQTGGPMRTR
jgi:hypothetical protein